MKTRNGADARKIGLPGCAVLHTLTSGNGQTTRQIVVAMSFHTASGLTGHWRCEEEVIRASGLSVRSRKSRDGGFDPEETLTTLLPNDGFAATPAIRAWTAIGASRA